MDYQDHINKILKELAKKNLENAYLLINQKFQDIQSYNSGRILIIKTQF